MPSTRAPSDDQADKRRDQRCEDGPHRALRRADPDLTNADPCITHADEGEAYEHELDADVRGPEQKPTRAVTTVDEALQRRKPRDPVDLGEGEGDERANKDH